MCALPACKAVWRKEGKNQIWIKIYTGLQPAPVLNINESKGRQDLNLFLYYFVIYS